MKNNITSRLLAGMSLLAVVATTNAELTITPRAGTGVTHAQALVDVLVGLNPNINTSNEQLLVNSRAAQYATFTGAEGFIPTGNAGLPIFEDDLPFSSGILLSTGRAIDAAGPNTSRQLGTGFHTGANPAGVFDFVSGATERDTAMLQFDFTMAFGVGISFDYVFGSEEYNAYVGAQFNDSFAFLLTDLSAQTGDPYATPTNIARIGNGPTDTVSINNFNNGSNSQYFTDNDLNDDLEAPYDLQFDGIVGGADNGPLGLLHATAATIPGHTYRIQIVIADISDNLNDSGVFLGGGSFSIIPPPPPTVPEPSTYIGALALAGLIARKLRRK